MILHLSLLDPALPAWLVASEVCERHQAATFSEDLAVGHAEALHSVRAWAEARAAAWRLRGFGDELPGITLDGDHPRCHVGADAVEALCAWLAPADEVVVWTREDTLSSVLFSAWVVALLRAGGRKTSVSVAHANAWDRSSPVSADLRRAVDAEALHRLWVCLTEAEPAAWVALAAGDARDEVRRVVRALLHRLPDATTGLSVVDLYLLRLLCVEGDAQALVFVGPAEVEAMLGEDLSNGMLDAFDNVGMAARVRLERMARHPDPLVAIAPLTEETRWMWTSRLSVTPRGRAVAEGRASAWGAAPVDDELVGHRQRPEACWVVDTEGWTVGRRAVLEATDDGG